MLTDKKRAELYEKWRTRTATPQELQQLRADTAERDAAEARIVADMKSTHFMGRRLDAALFN